jgi:hypothetical protein
LEDVGCKTHSNLGRKISIQWRPRHSGFERHGGPAKAIRGQSSGYGAS